MNLTCLHEYIEEILHLEDTLSGRSGRKDLREYMNSTPTYIKL